MPDKVLNALFLCTGDSARSILGEPGSGGCHGFADPKAGIGCDYVTNQMGTALTGDPRDLALRNAVHSIIQPRRP